MTHRRTVARRMLAAFYAAYPQYRQSAARAVAASLPVGAFLYAWGWTWGSWAREDEGER